MERTRATVETCAARQTAPSREGQFMLVDNNPRTSCGVMSILLFAAFVVILNETTMNVALSSIMANLGITERTAQWLTTEV